MLLWKKDDYKRKDVQSKNRTENERILKRRQWEIPKATPEFPLISTYMPLEGGASGEIKKTRVFFEASNICTITSPP